MPYAKASSPSQLPQSLVDFLQIAHHQHQTIVLATGVFDVLHVEHENFLKKAKAVGDVLIVGLESDSRVRTIKGPGRPINNEQTRLANIEKLEIADQVFVLPDQFVAREDYSTLIDTIRPAILAVSSHTLHLDSKQMIMAKVGGEVKVVHQHNPHISTSQILNQQGVQ